MAANKNIIEASHLTKRYNGFTAVNVISLFAGFKLININGLFLAFIIMLLTAVLFTALGTAIASVLDDIHGFQLIMNFLIMPLFFLSGAMFPLKGLSGFLRVIAIIDPLSYGVDGLRGALVGMSHFGLPLDFSILTLATAVLLVIGSYLFSKIKI